MCAVVAVVPPDCNSSCGDLGLPTGLTYNQGQCADVVESLYKCITTY
jgi:hypothetical protein